MIQIDKKVQKSGILLPFVFAFCFQVNIAVSQTATTPIPGDPVKIESDLISGKSSGEIEMSNKMSDALVAFAKTGNPNTPAIKWPAYTSKNPIRKTFGDMIESVPVDKGVFYLLAHPEVKLGGMMMGGRGPGGSVR